MTSTTSTCVRDLLGLNPTNPVKTAALVTPSNKDWATTNYHPTRCLIVHSTIDPTEGTYDADLSILWSPGDDDNLRLQEPAFPPNKRNWHCRTEADWENWFHTEVSNIVLAAWSRYPVVTQYSHQKSLSEQFKLDEEVDLIYTDRDDSGRIPIIIGEMKRGTIIDFEWQNAQLSTGQRRLSQELRGYAHKYGCPLIFCFDGETLLLLRFRAFDILDIKREDLEVDTWVIRRQDCKLPLRNALYTFLHHGFRRYQGLLAPPLVIGGLQPLYRRWYDGKPIWGRADGSESETPPVPGDYSHVMEANGAIKWLVPRTVEERSPFRLSLKLAVLLLEEIIPIIVSSRQGGEQQAILIGGSVDCLSKWPFTWPSGCSAEGS
ncbi:hypothetical protein PT974_01424 [Cladobotryum mycophilum]|uniref:Uncharacterized protein n=1 Tax=Cladobotryum mycophilum TaxID=491253 RepID=A0ABR0T3X1_9HYPO